MAEPSNIASAISIPAPSSVNAPVDDHDVTADSLQAHTPGAMISGLNRRLLDAAFDDNAQEVKQCLKEGADIEAKTEDGETALHLASWHGMDELASILIQNGAQIDAKDNNDWSPLHNAANKGHLGVIRLLLDHGANLEAKIIGDECTPLMAAVCGQHVEAVKALLVNSVGVNMPGKHDTPLTRACLDGSNEIVRILLEHDADVNLPDPDGWTPLHTAFRYSAATTVEILLQESPELNFKNPDGWTPLHFATRYGTTKMVKLILEGNPDVNSVNSDGWTPLYLAIRYGYRDMVHLILEKNPNIHVKDSGGWTPFHMAARYGRSEVLRMILEKKPEINATDSEGWTALQLAVRYRNIEIVTMVLGENPDIDAPDDDGFTALHKAHRCRRVKDRAKIAELLLKKGAKFLSTTTEKQTPLHRASEMGCTAVVEVYLRHADRLDINALATDGWTALHFASYNGFGKVVDTLLDKGASFALETKDGNQTALALSIKGLNNLSNRDLDIESLIEQKAAKRPTEQAAHHAEQQIEPQSTEQRTEILEDQPQTEQLVEPQSTEQRTEILEDQPQTEQLVEPQSTEHPTEMLEDQPAQTETEGESEDEDEEETQDLPRKERLEDCKLAIQLLAQKKVNLESTMAVLRNLDSLERLGIAIEILQKAGNYSAEEADFDQTKLIWRAMRSNEHENLRLLLQTNVVDTSFSDIKKPKTLLQWAAYRGNFAVVWWLLRMSDPHNQHESTTNRQDRDKAIQIINEKLKIITEAKDKEKKALNTTIKQPRNMPFDAQKQGTTTQMAEKSTKKSNISHQMKIKETPDHYTLLEEEQARYYHTLDILQDPPLVIGRKFESGFCEAPKLEKGSARDKITQQHKATIVDFYSHDERVELLRRSSSLHDVIYNTEKDGPAKLMEKTTDALKSIGLEERLYEKEDLKMRWIHLPANNMEWMEDLVQRLFFDQKKPKTDYAALRDFLRGSWQELPSGDSETKSMKPNFMERFSRKPTPTPLTEQPDTGTDRNQDEIDEPKPAKTMEEPARNNEDNSESDSTPLVPPTTQTNSDKSKPKPAEDIDGNDSTAALYIPYLTFEKCFEANEASRGLDKSAQAGNQEIDSRNGNFRADYKNLMDTYNDNGKRQVLQGSRSLDQFYYQALPDIKQRNADQVVTRFLLDKERGNKTKNDDWWPILSIGQLWLWIIDTNTVISCSTLRPDGLEDPVVEWIFEHLRERNNRGGGAVPPSSALDLAKIIVNFCINFTHTTNWSRIVLRGVEEDEKYPRIMQEIDKGRGMKKKGGNEESKEDKEKRRMGRFMKSPCEIFAETINQTAVAENSLFTGFVKKVEHKKNGNGISPKETQNEEDKVASEELKDWISIYNAALLLEEVKDIRDELNMIKTVLTQQKVVWEGLLGQGGKMSQAMKSRMGTERNLADILEEIIEMDKIAGTIQTSVKETLDLEQNGINITEAVLSRDLAKQSARQGTTIMAFTVVTIFFLPMSFLASLFALNVTSFQHDSQGNVQFSPEFIFPIIFCVSIALGIFIIYVSFNYKWVLDSWGKLRHYSSQSGIRIDHPAPNKQAPETVTRSNQIPPKDTASMLTTQSQDAMLSWIVERRRSRREKPNRGPIDS